MHSDKVSSTASEGRKSSKPIMEKRRRARINASLAELKSLLLEVMKKEGARQNKMEKADILEMTVKHLRQLQRQQFSALASSDPAIINKYRLGFNECASEVSKFLGSQDSMDAEVRAKLLNHLANVVVSTEGTSAQNVAPQPQVPTNSTVSPTSGNNNILQLSSTPISVQSSLPIQSVPTIICPPNTNGSCQPHFENKCNNIVNTNGGINLQVQTQYQTSDINNTMTINTPVQSFVGGQQMQFTKVVNGLQVLPTKMSSGDMALIIPANLIQGGTIPNYVIPVLSSSNVTPCQTTVSPVNISQSTMSTVPPKEIMAPSSVMTFPVNISANTSGINTDIIQMKPVFEQKSVESNQTSPTFSHQHRPGSVTNSYQNDSLQKLDNMWRPW